MVVNLAFYFYQYWVKILLTAFICKLLSYLGSIPSGGTYWFRAAWNFLFFISLLFSVQQLYKYISTFNFLITQQIGKCLPFMTGSEKVIKWKYLIFLTFVPHMIKQMISIKKTIVDMFNTAQQETNLHKYDPICKKSMHWGNLTFLPFHGQVTEFM